MFWYLLLAHFIGDYPFQSDWMVAHRKRIAVRLLHGAIHFGLMALLTVTIFLKIWPYLLLLAVIHLLIDFGKTWLTPRLPAWNVPLYFVDQAVHFLALGLVAAWIEKNVAVTRLPLNRLVVLIAIGFIVTTYVWLITERILLGGRSFSDELGARAWPRAFIRAGLLAIVLLGWNALGFKFAGRKSALPGTMGMAILLPYPATRSGARALLIDLLVTFVVAGFIILASR